MARATELWLNYSGSSEGVVYTVTSHRSPLLVQHPHTCPFVEVLILNNNDSFEFPCFSCFGFVNPANYENDFRGTLFTAISGAVVLPTMECAVAIAEDLLHSVLLPANESGATHVVEIRVDAPLRTYDDDDDDDDLDEEEIRAVNELFEEAGAPQRKPCALESVIKMVMERFRLEGLEGEKAENDWKECDDHDCMICMEEIESVWDSLTTPCSHVFHEICLTRWLNDNHACPLCRFELPLEVFEDSYNFPCF